MTDCKQVWLFMWPPLTALEPGVVSETLSAQLWVQEQKAPVSIREAEGMVEHPASHRLRHHIPAPLRSEHAQHLLDQSMRGPLLDQSMCSPS